MASKKFRHPPHVKINREAMVKHIGAQFEISGGVEVEEPDFVERLADFSLNYAGVVAAYGRRQPSRRSLERHAIKARQTALKMHARGHTFLPPGMVEDVPEPNPIGVVMRMPLDIPEDSPPESAQ
ncbi:MAG TPA: hypothetical protein VG604_01515 [Candidatus Saccharimonadales bacterium]|nr:hypothetical protein [Candidatus Saccharimonadales bacterium]